MLVSELHVDPLSVELYQLDISPVPFVMVNTPEFPAIQTLVGPEIVPAEDGWSTKMVSIEEVSLKQELPPTITRYRETVEILEKLYEVLDSPSEFHVDPLSIENSQTETVPDSPDKSIVPLLLPLHTVVFAERAPPIEIGSTIILATVEVSVLHPCTITLYHVSTKRFEKASEFDMFAIVLQEPPSLVDDSQWSMVPDSPVRDIVPLFPETHTLLAVDVRVPPNAPGFTKTDNVSENVGGHTPLWTFTL